MKEMTFKEMQQVQGGSIALSCAIGIAGLAAGIIGGAMTGGIGMVIYCAIGVAGFQDGCFN